MATAPLQQVLHRLRQLVGQRGADQTSDARVLERFVRASDERAFEFLLGRHGPMVLGVCQRILGDSHLAEDVFQATFLVLVRKAASLRQPERVGNWLHGVATRLALKARADAARRRERQQEMSDMPGADTTEAVDWRDLHAVLDQEIGRLPGKYREPFVMAYLEGRTNAEVAKELGCPEGTVFGRLARARERLRFRLARRGVTLSGATLGALLAKNSLMTAVPAALAGATLRAASLLTAAKTAIVGGVSASVAALVKGALQDMFLKRLKVTMLLVLSVGLLGLGGAFARQRILVQGSPAAGAADKPGSSAPKPAPGDKPLPAGALARIDSTRFRFVRDSISQIAYSPDGRLLAAAGYGNQLEARKLSVGMDKGPPALRLAKIFPDSFTLSPSGSLLALRWGVEHRMGGGGGTMYGAVTVQVWDTTTGKKLHELPEGWARATVGSSSSVLTFSPDGRTLYSQGLSEQTVHALEVATGKERFKIEGVVGSRFVLSPDGKTLASWKGRTIRLWETATGKER
jgi:RNA polymerase sigma factor (sigma-70 family)